VSESNVKYRLLKVRRGIAFIEEIYDLTKPCGPGILMRAGQIVDANAEGLVSATRTIWMPVKQAKKLGFMK
jgi:hypothetical protein